MSKVAIIGRPNVGKSTLFNRLVGRKLALVDDQPGVTRDRREGEAELRDLKFTLIDTAGLDDAAENTLAGRMRLQTEVAVEDADILLFVIDSRVGLTSGDRHFADLVRRAGKPIVLVANKAEGRAGETGAYEAYDLGLGVPVALSAEHGEGMVDLYDAIAAVLPQAKLSHRHDEPEIARVFGDDEDGTELDESKPLRIAVVGRPNAGKSTLLNSILGQDRLLTGPEPGITRDAIGLDAEWHGRALKIFDTAGLRKRARIEDKLEKLAAGDAIRAVKFAEVVVVLLDSTIPFEKQDLTIASLTEREGRAIVIGLNKWDLIDARGSRLSELKEEADRLLPQMRGMPVVPLSGLTGFNTDKLMEAIIRVHAIWNRRISTARLNRWLETVLEQNPPPAVSGRRIKIRYMTQAKARPPTFILFGNQLPSLPTSYSRFLVNGLRETFDLPGVPVRIIRGRAIPPTTRDGDRDAAGCPAMSGFLDRPAVTIVPPSAPIRGAVAPPGSKSITNRALLLAALAPGESRLTGALKSDDTRLMATALRQMGVAIDEPGETQFDVRSSGRLLAPADRLFLGNAGTATRFLTAMVATVDGTVVIDGDAHMRKRPIGPLIDALRASGVAVDAPTGCPPITIHGIGRFTAARVEIDAALSSQYVSAILMAAALSETAVEVVLAGQDIGARGYVDLTIAAMRSFGASVEQRDRSAWLVAPTRYRAADLHIEPDASAATYLWAAEALTGGAIDIGTPPDAFTQPDARAKTLIDAFPAMPPVIDGSQMQDAVPTLAVLAAFNATPVRFVGIGNLRVKECDRINALSSGLNASAPASRTRTATTSWSHRTRPSAARP